MYLLLLSIDITFLFFIFSLSFLFCFIFNVLQVHTHFTAWRDNVWNAEKFREEETGKDQKHFTLTDALMSIGDNHLQATEVRILFLILSIFQCMYTYYSNLKLTKYTVTNRYSNYHLFFIIRCVSSCFYFSTIWLDQHLYVNWH